jgi:hypothetical protein
MEARPLLLPPGALEGVVREVEAVRLARHF